MKTFRARLDRLEIATPNTEGTDARRRLFERLQRADEATARRVHKAIRRKLDTPRGGRPET